MNLGLPEPLVDCVAWLTLAASVRGVFDYLDDTLLPHVKQEVSKWLKNPQLSSSRIGWSTTFPSVFDRLFGTNHLTLGCFLRSAIASMCMEVIATLVMVGLGAAQFAYYTEVAGTAKFWLLYAGLCAANTLPDYMSLLETRWVIGLMAKTTSILRTAELLALDFVATYMIGAVTLGSAIAVTVVLVRPRANPWMEILTDSLWTGFTMPLTVGTSTGTYGILGPTGVWFLSTFLTSLWIWGYAGGGALIRALVGLGRGGRWFGKYFQVDEKPMKCLGLAINILIAILFVVLLIIRLSIRHPGQVPPPPGSGSL